jgi:hypothetical protein
MKTDVRAIAVTIGAGILGLLVLVATPATRAQATNVMTDTSVPLTGATTVKGQVVVPDRPTAPDVASVTALRPDRVERPALSPAVQTRIERFKVEARAYLQRQEALKKKLVGANDADRAAIRAQIEELRHKWLEDSKRFRTDTKARAPELIRKLPGYKEVIGSPGSGEGDRDR